MNSGHGLERKKVLFFITMLAIGAIAIITYLSITGNALQVYNDVVNEYTAIDGSNKSAERIMIYIFSFAGALVYSVFYLKECKQNSLDEHLMNKDKKNNSLYVSLGILICLGCEYFIYSRANWLLISGLALVLIFNTVDVSLVIPGTIFMLICSYAICALYQIYVFYNGLNFLSMRTVALVSLVLSVIILVKGKEKGKKLYLNGILLLQVIIPFSLLCFFSSKYKYADDYVTITVPYKIKIIIGIVIISYILEALNGMRKNWKKEVNIGKIISSGTYVTIMSLNRYSGNGSIISTDLHHSFENTIGYSQIVELGQKAFTQYTPVSGLYSLVQGFFLSFFGNGQASFYNVTSNLFYLFVIILTVLLLKKQLKGEWILFISLIFPVSDYNRVAFLVPEMLLLAWPKLIGKKNLWLKTWYLTSFLHGLYYPTYGAAVCIGFLPLGIWQCITYVRSGELLKDIKKISFWIGWIVYNVPVALGYTTLIGLVKHIKAMGSQTVYADGIARFGQAVPGDFFSYIQLLPTRLILYYIFSFLIVISIIWISVALFLKNGNVKLDDNRLKIEKPVPAFISLSFGIVLLISLSSTIIRLDINSIYARSAGVVYASFVMITLVVSRYMPREKNCYIVFAFAVFIRAVVSSGGFWNIEYNSKLEAYYTVPEEYVYIIDDQVDKLGECFVAQETYSLIENTYNYTSNMDKNKSYLGVVNNFGLFYLCNIKGGSVMEIIPTIKGFRAAQETVDLIRNNGTIVGSRIDSISNYYFYHWLLTSGEYIWHPDQRVFIPNDGDVTKEEILLQNKNIDVSTEARSLGRTAGSWGSSMKTLSKIFRNVEIGYTTSIVDSKLHIAFDKSIDGDDADFLYLEFADVNQNYEYILFNHSEDAIQDVEKYAYARSLMKKDYNRDIVVIVSWTDDYGNEHSMNCRLERGKLLIPLGGGRGWLLNNHSYITITVMRGEEIIDNSDIVSIGLLKLQEIK